MNNGILPPADFLDDVGGGTTQSPRADVRRRRDSGRGDNVVVVPVKKPIAPRNDFLDNLRAHKMGGDMENQPFSD